MAFRKKKNIFFFRAQIQKVGTSDGKNLKDSSINGHRFTKVNHDTMTQQIILTDKMSLH